MPSCSLMWPLAGNACSVNRGLKCAKGGPVSQWAQNKSELRGLGVFRAPTGGAEARWPKVTGFPVGLRGYTSRKRAKDPGVTAGQGEFLGARGA